MNQGPQNPELREVLENYVTEIKELTFNSKLIINNLTIIAEENKQVASEIVNIIENRLQTAPKDQCLPTLYLLDSITKNVGEPYLSLFARNLVHNFISTYLSVNEKTQESMVHLLKTWQTVFTGKYAEIISHLPLQPARSSTNRPVGIDAAKEVLAAAKLLPSSRPENENGKNVNTAAYSSIPVPIGAINQQPVYSVNIPPTPSISVNTVLPQTQIYATPLNNNIIPNNNPYQQIVNNIPYTNMNYPQNYNAYNQTLQLQQLYASLLNQLATPVATPVLVNPPLQPMVSTMIPLPENPSPYNYNNPSSIPIPNTNINNPNINLNINTHNINNTNINPISIAPNASNNINNPNTNQVQNNPKPVYNIPKHPRPSKTIGTAFSREIIKSKNLYIIDEIYHSDWNQCTTCAYRFPDPTKFSDHLDWHFKINRREKEKLKKPLSREWFLPVDEWVQYEGAEYVQKPSPSFFPSSPDSTKEEKKNNYIKKDEDNNQACPVCGENFESFYESDEDEWMLVDVVKKEGVIYHETCVQDNSQVLSPMNAFGLLGKRSPLNDAENEDEFNKRQKLDHVIDY